MISNRSVTFFNVNKTNYGNSSIYSCIKRSLLYCVPHMPLRVLVPYVLRASRALSYVLLRFTYLVSLMPCVLRALVPYLPCILRVLVSHVARALRSIVLQVPRVLRVLVLHLPLYLTCLVLYVPSCFMRPLSLRTHSASYLSYSMY